MGIIFIQSQQEITLNVMSTRIFSINFSADDKRSDTVLNTLK